MLKMATARLSAMGVRLQVLLIITSPPVGELSRFERARHKSSSGLAGDDLFVYLANPSQEIQ
jgi:hypothetical protein